MRSRLLRLLLAAALLGSCSAGSPARPTGRAGSPSPSPAVSTSASPTPEPAFDGSVSVIDDAALAAMGTSWRPGCPVPLHDLRVLRMNHWTFDGGIARGELIVNESQADNVLRAFEQIFRARFPIANMVIANGYIGDDPARAQQNATSAFNCRQAVGRSTISEHAYGLAVDINPVQNPRVSTSGAVVPPGGEAYVDRSQDRPGMIHPGDAVVRAFDSIGWIWGGTYTKSKDYQHFSLNGM